VFIYKVQYNLLCVNKTAIYETLNARLLLQFFLLLVVDKLNIQEREAFLLVRKLICRNAFGGI